MNLEKFLEDNPNISTEDIIRRSDGRIEYLCEHGIGHTIYSFTDNYVHGCDGCCKNLKF